MRTYKVGCALLKDGKLYDVRVFEGNKKECAVWINDTQKKMMIDDFIKSEFVVNFAYAEGTEKNIEEWYTIAQLLEMGAVE